MYIAKLFYRAKKMFIYFSKADSGICNRVRERNRHFEYNKLGETNETYFDKKIYIEI